MGQPLMSTYILYIYIYVNLPRFLDASRRQVSIEKDQLPVEVLTASMSAEQLKILEDRRRCRERLRTARRRGEWSLVPSSFLFSNSFLLLLARHLLLVAMHLLLVRTQRLPTLEV